MPGLILSFFKTMRLPALTSTLLMLPWLALELANQPSARQDFPFAIFAFLWLLPLVFVLILLPMVVELRTGITLKRRWLLVLLKSSVLLLIAWAWGSFLVDQMPCFFGVPNCD